MNDKAVIGLRFEEGTYLPKVAEEAVSEATIGFADVSGFGELNWVDLEGPGGRPMRLEGPLTLVDLKGRIRTLRGVALRDFVCTLSRLTDNGIQMLGGKLLRAEVKFVEIAIVPLQDTADGASVSAPAPAPAPAQPVERLVSDSSLPDPPIHTKETDPPEDLSDRWARAVDESDRVQQHAKDKGIDFDMSDVKPKRGDYVNHQQFGKCTVARIGDDHITLRKPDGRNVQLGLPILRFTSEGKEGKKGVFRVEVRTKR